MRETEAAARALVDYIARATDAKLPKEEKSLEALARHYQGIKAAGEDPPTVSHSALLKWSQAHSWQDRLDAHVRSINAETFRRMKTDMAGVRVRRLKLVGKALSSIETQLDGGTPADPKELTKLVEIEAKLYGEPLADKTDVNVTGNLDVGLIDKLSPETRQGLLRDLEGEDEEADPAVDEAGG